MTILTVVQDVCVDVGVVQPTSIFSGLTANRTMQEMLGVANEMAQRISYDTRDWTRLRAVATHVGDGVVVPPPPAAGGKMTGTTAFDLPANYKRMLLTSNLWRTNFTQTPMKFVPDTDEWLIRRARGSIDGVGEWTILGGQIHVYPVLPAGHTVYYTYLDKNCVALAGGGYGDRFLNDADTFVVDERLLKLGMIWQWRAKKGSPYAEDMGTYSDAILNLMGKDQPAPIIYGRGNMSGHPSYGGPGPWPL